MDNLDDSENNAKISDSAYSNSCSNSQSRRSHSSKSTHSGSSGSSGYGGKLSTSGSSNKLEQSRKDKDGKKKKQSQNGVKVAEEPVVECKAPEPIPLFDLSKDEITKDVVEATQKPLSLPDNAIDDLNLSSAELANIKHEVQITTVQTLTSVSLETSCQVANVDSGGFTCAISMHDGVVMYTTQNLTTNLCYPKDMWIGRSFIDFVHPKDRNTFASLITNGLAVPKIVNGTQTKDQSAGMADCKMICRIRRYKSLVHGFVVKDGIVAYMPFLLRFSFKDINEDKSSVVYLIIQATPVYHGYSSPHELKTDATAFVIKHSAEGLIEYVDIESVQYLGYLPQDLHNMDALMLYHPDDLPSLKMTYEMIVKEGSVAQTIPYRMMTQNGDYVKLKTEWSSFINPWSMKLEFVIGKHQVIEGPASPNVFMAPPPKPTKLSEADKLRSKLAETNRHDILRILKDVLTKPAEKVKQQKIKRCHDLALIMESLLKEQARPKDELRVEMQEPGTICSERDSEMLGGISPHHENNENGSSTETLLSYNQLNYNENLQRFFDSHQNCRFEENNTMLSICESTPKPSLSNCMLSPIAQNSPESNDVNSFGSSAMSPSTFSPPAPKPETPTMRLTESILTKHNNDMEKELAKCRRSTRSNKGEQVDTRQKKKEHLARCNATYQPTMAGAAEAKQVHGVKRSIMSDCEGGSKQHCPQTRQGRRRQVTSADEALETAAASKTTGVSPMYYALSINPGIMGAVPTMPQHPCDTITPIGPITPAITPMPHNTNATNPWMYPQSVYGSPYMYSQMAFGLQQQPAMMAQTMAYQTLYPLGLPDNNYMQACKTLPLRTSQPVVETTCAGRPEDTLAKDSERELEITVTDTASTAVNRDSETWHKETQAQKSESQITAKQTEPLRKEEIEPAKNQGPLVRSGNNCVGTTDRSDESSYSSFYSSFFKTDSGSAEDSSDPKKAATKVLKDVQSGPLATSNSVDPQINKKVLKRTMNPPWMESVCITPELIYKYQIPSRSMEEVLRADMEKMKLLEQPTLVNEQLDQLYLDLHSEGVEARLKLEEGSTSSSSSGDEACFSVPSAKPPRRKRKYCQLNMIYEEDAPLPPPPTASDEICPEAEPEALS